jgi:hypothetical protein
MLGKGGGVAGASGKGAALALAGLLLAPGVACRREDPKIKELTVRAAQADDASRQLRQAWMAQMALLPLLGRSHPRPAAPYAIPFTPEQVRFLEARVNAERDVSRQTLIREALAQDREIRELGERLTRLKAGLPTPDIAQPQDTHAGLALRFLLGRGVPEAQARRLLGKVPLLPRLTPGFEVYHVYENGVYTTWVTQGSAPVSPRNLGLEAVEHARDRARARNGRLDRALEGLLAQKCGLELELAELHIQRAAFLEERETLRNAQTAAATTLNSLHFLVGTREDLLEDGVVVLPFLGKGRAGPRWRDALFTQHLDLRQGHALRILAEDAGLERIGTLEVIPGSYVPGEDFSLEFSPDRRAVTVELRSLERFRNTKVVFALAE